MTFLNLDEVRKNLFSVKKKPGKVGWKRIRIGLWYVLLQVIIAKFE